jgi:hypothetical protein
MRLLAGFGEKRRVRHRCIAVQSVQQNAAALLFLL